MSKMLIVSDSHGLTDELQQIKARHENETDLMIHCGDSELMADDAAIKGFTVVRGNCDYEAGYPDETTVALGGRKIFITHGHHHSVKTSLMSLHYRAKELKADIVCFGHSHILGAEEAGGTLFLNPGSIRLPRRRIEKTYMILELLDRKIILSVFDIDGKEIKDLYREFSLPNQ